MSNAGGAGNSNTGEGANEPGPRMPASELTKMWAAYVPGLAAIPPRDPRAMAFRLFWTRGAENGWRDFPLGAGQHVIVGRHTRCDIVLPTDPDVSLRHLLVVPIVSDVPRLRLVDLRAALPMYALSDRPARSLSVDGPFALRLGTYMLAGFPVGPGTDAPPVELPPMESIESPSASSDVSLRKNAATRIGHDQGPYRSRRKSTTITSLPRPITLVEASDAPSAGPALVTMLGRREGQLARVALREEDLRRGVLVGRAEKCLDRGLKLVMTMQISRVHAVLLLDDRDTVWLYDAGSTNGTLVAGTKVRSATLAELAPFVARSKAVLGDGIEIELGDDVVTVRVESDGAIATIVLDRPNVRNAIDRATAEALADAVRAFEADASLRVAVIHGDHGTFCAGADLSAIAKGTPNRVERGGDAPLGPTRMQPSKPILASIAGHAVAGGLELALFCDLRVVEESAVLGVFCRRWGVPLIDGGTVRLPRIVGLGRALDLVLTGRAVSSAEALAMGLVSRVVPDGTARTAAESLAREIAAFPWTCVLEDRASVYESMDRDFQSAMENELEHGLRSLAAPELAVTKFVGGAGRGGSFTK